IFQFIQNQHTNQFDLIPQTNIDQQLKPNKITIPNIPNQPNKHSFITPQNKPFKQDHIHSFKNQTPHIQNIYTIQTNLKHPFLNTKSLSKHN
ncbi:two-component system regulatory protein YycI, partial [Bacillus thuringiensis]|uniref:two-component system regulatory protein YycI n=1 Tax=Bacillus thuringiensis TaxID=1428 RepID=UPI001C92C4A8